VTARTIFAAIVILMGVALVNLELGRRAKTQPARA
jgi:hypothetical protein